MIAIEQEVCLLSLFSLNSYFCSFILVFWYKLMILISSVYTKTLKETAKITAKLLKKCSQLVLEKGILYAVGFVESTFIKVLFQRDACCG